MGVLAKVAQLRWVKVTLDLDSFGGKARSAQSVDRDKPPGARIRAAGSPNANIVR
jgi:hypothetical protein